MQRIMTCGDENEERWFVEIKMRWNFIAVEFRYCKSVKATPITRAAFLALQSGWKDMKILDGDVNVIEPILV